MRILYVITKANWGGAQKYVYELARAAREAGHDVSVAYGETGALLEKLADAGIPAHAVPGMRNEASFAALRAAEAALYELFRTARPDAVHLNSSLASVAGAAAAKRAGIARVLFTSHGWAFNESRPLWQRAVIRLLSWLTVLRSTATICVSDAIRKDIAWMPFTHRKLVVIPNGVTCATRMSPEEARARLSLPMTGVFAVGMLSELIPTKRVEDAVNAMKSLAEDHPETHLLVMGEGPERERLETLIREAGLEEQVRLAGFVKDGASFLSAFDLFLHSSRSEALGYAVLEAGCASLPVVATRVGGIPEIIPDDSYGLLVPPENPIALAEAMKSLVEDRESARSMGARLHARVVQEFSAERMLRATLAEYAR
jgi:glycosyltransferase involved in cell wall biosynthesis